MRISPGWTATRETWLDRAREHDEPPDLDANEDWEEFTPLTAEELAEAREGATAGPAVWAAMAGRRGPGQPGSARAYPGFRWTTPAGRTYTTEPTRYPI